MPASSQRRQPLASCLRGFRLGIRLEQVVDRLARGLGVLELGLAVGDSEHRLGRARALGRARDEAAEGRDRLLVVAPRVLRVAEPEQRRLAVAAVREALQQAAEAARGAVELAAAKAGQGFVVT